jgi:hypothetical protein
MNNLDLQITNIALIKKHVHSHKTEKDSILDLLQPIRTENIADTYSPSNTVKMYARMHFTHAYVHAICGCSSQQLVV